MHDRAIHSGQVTDIRLCNILAEGIHRQLAAQSASLLFQPALQELFGDRRRHPTVLLDRHQSALLNSLVPAVRRDVLGT